MSATEDTPGAGHEAEGTAAPDGTATAAAADQTVAPGAEEMALVAAPEVVANNLGEYLQAWGRRIRNGESGALPVITGLIAIVIFFQLEQSKFLSGGNLVNLFIQAALYIMFGAAEFFALILSEIDLSLGYLAGVCAFVIAALMASNVGLPWWVALIGGLVVGAAAGAFQGALITRLGLPSFVVTLGGLLGFEGVMLEIASVDKAATGGVLSIPSSSPISKLTSSEMSATVSWIVLVVVLAVFAAWTLRSVQSRRAKGLTAPPMSVALLTIGLVAVGGVVVVLICNTNRGLLTPIRGVPWVIPFVLIVLLLYAALMGRTKLGRYLYAIGNNPEAARRAGINVPLIRTIGFALGGMTAAFAGLVYLSTQGSIATNIPGGNEVLFAVAAAVIGGTSLFGGRGKPMQTLLGGLVIAVVYNGLELMSVNAAVQYMATAVVLILAVMVDALVRRRSATIR
jgi:D-xylose transport system permease protein